MEENEELKYKRLLKEEYDRYIKASEEAEHYRSLYFEALQRHNLHHDNLRATFTHIEVLRSFCYLLISSVFCTTVLYNSYQYTTFWPCISYLLTTFCLSFFYIGIPFCLFYFFLLVVEATTLSRKNFWLFLWLLFFFSLRSLLPDSNADALNTFREELYGYDQKKKIKISSAP